MPYLSYVGPFHKIKLWKIVNYLIKLVISNKQHQQCSKWASFILQKFENYNLQQRERHLLDFWNHRKFFNSNAASSRLYSQTYSLVLTPKVTRTLIVFHLVENKVWQRKYKVICHTLQYSRRNSFWFKYKIYQMYRLIWIGDFTYWIVTR